MPLYAICAAHAFDNSEPQDVVEASSRLLLANGLGAILGPVAAAAFMGHWDQAGCSFRRQSPISCCLVSSFVVAR